MHGHSKDRLTRRDFLRIVTGVSAGLVGAGVLSGCGSQAPAAQAPAPAAPAAKAPAPAAPAPAAPAAKPTAPQAAPTGAPAAAAAPSGTATYSMGTDLASIDPHRDTSRQALNVLRNYYETLVEQDDKLNQVPGLAASWKRVNLTTWEFKLREGVKFHNGQPLTTADVKFNFDRIKDTSLGLRVTPMLATVDGIEVIDATTFRVITNKVDPIIPARFVTHPTILPGETWNKMGEKEFTKGAIGTGPYKMVEWVKDDRLVMEANPNYWGSKARIAKLIHKPILEASTRVAALRTGAVDLTAYVQPQQIREIESDPKLRIVRTPNARVFFVGMNAFRKPFTDVRVRQAFNYAVDVDAIVKDLWEGHAYRTPTIVSKDWFGFDPDQKPYPYDPAKAKALLAEAGYPNGLEVTFNTPKGRYQLDVETAEAVSGYLAKVGVNAKVEVVEYANYLARLFDAKNPDNRFTMFYMGYSIGLLDIDDMLGSYLDSRRRGYYYHDPKLDALMDKGLQAATPEERKVVYKELLAHVKEMAPWIFLFNGEDIYGSTKRLTGWSARADEILELRGAYLS